MNEKGKTIAVIASGFNNIYPIENKRLFNEIIESGGLIISEWEPNKEIDSKNFPKRNRIISGISIATLIIEARYKSGTLITAKYALEQEKELFCIPGNIDSINSLGSNLLIKKGAQLVTTPNDIIETLKFRNKI